MNRQIILFGAGRDGREALDFFGSEAVFCYVDNGKEKIGTDIEGKKVISIEDLSKLLEKYDTFKDICFEVVITIGVSRWAVFAVANQLKNIGIENFSIYSDVKKRWKTGEEFVQRNLSQYPCEQESILEIYKYQLDWLIRHTNATDLKPAVNDLRKSQLESLEYVKQFFEAIKESSLKPFMIQGSLIGAVRHKGFIPWDDDMDFGLIKEDFEKLIEFCENQKGIKVFYLAENGLFKTKEGALICSPKEYPFLVAYGYGFIQVYYNVGELHCKENKWITDIFKLSYFRDDFTLDDYKKEHNHWLDIRKKFFFETDEIYKNLTETNEIIVSKSNKVGYEFDFSSMLDYSHLLNRRSYDRCLWSVDDLFPLQKLQFEDTEFYAPHNAENWIKQLNPNIDIMSIPRKSVGIYVHNKDLIFTEKY